MEAQNNKLPIDNKDVLYQAIIRNPAKEIKYNSVEALNGNFDPKKIKNRTDPEWAKQMIDALDRVQKLVEKRKKNSSKILCIYDYIFIGKSKD